MIRVLAPEPLADATRLVTLDDDESHHLRVRRAAAGDPAEVLDGRGRIGVGRLEAQGKGWQVTLDQVRTVPAPVELVLLVGGGDKDRFAWLVEKAVELGVTEVVPLDTERSRHVASRVRDEHRGRLEQRAAEALKQCGGAWALRIGRVTGLPAAFAGVTTTDRWLADPSGAELRTAGPDRSVAIVVGPEGGLTAAEGDGARAAGFVPVALGGRILRFETAAMAAATIVGLSRKERG